MPRLGSRFFRRIENTLGLTPNGVMLLAFCVVAWGVARWAGSKGMFLLSYGLGFVLVVAFLTSRRRLAVDAVRSELAPRIREGQLVTVRLELVSRRRLSTVVFEEVLPDLLGSSVRVPVSVLPAGQTVDHLYTFAPRLRGVYAVGPLTAVWNDPLGLTRKRATILEAAEVLVHPSSEYVQDRVTSREWEDPPVRPPFSKPWPTGFEFYGMRDYQLGDDPRRIVWRAAARSWDPDRGEGHLLVRESEQGITDRVAIILDTDGRGHTPGRPSSSFEFGVKAAASLGTQHLREGFAVTIESNGGRLVDRSRGQTATIALLDELARVQPEALPLSDTFDRMLFENMRATHVVVISPKIDDHSAARLRLLIERGSSLMVAALVDESDEVPQWVHRVATMGCQVVEMRLGRPLYSVFGTGSGAGVRQH